MGFSVDPMAIHRMLSSSKASAVMQLNAASAGCGVSSIVTPTPSIASAKAPPGDDAIALISLATRPE
jgi:hypothetical protein